MDNSHPPRCLDCAKADRQQPHDDCRVCRDFQLNETLLCELNRMIQKPERLQCRAFQPRLRLAGALKELPALGARSAPPPSQLRFLRDFLTSEKTKYHVALARQKLEQNPDEIITNLKYHVLWNTRHRWAVFKPPNIYFEGLYDLFLGFGEMVGGMAAVMWVAPDHLHVYLETDGRKSIETLQKKMKTESARTIREKFPEISGRLRKGAGLWDQAYFVETIG